MSVVTKEDLYRMADQLVAVGTEERFIEAMQAISRTPAAEQPKVAAELARVDRLVASTDQVPDGLRVSPRWFEDPARAAANGVVEPDAPVVVYDDDRGAISWGGVVVLIDARPDR